MNTIVPVGVVQVGWVVTEAVGAAVVGTGLTVRLSIGDMQPLAVFCAVMLYVFGAKAENVVED